MRTVWKQALAITDEQRFLLNADSKPLCAAEQHGQLCMWYETDPDAQGA